MSKGRSTIQGLIGGILNAFAAGGATVGASLSDVRVTVGLLCGLAVTLALLSVGSFLEYAVLLLRDELE